MSPTWALLFELLLAGSIATAANSDQQFVERMARDGRPTESEFRRLFEIAGRSEASFERPLALGQLRKHASVEMMRDIILPGLRQPADAATFRSRVEVTMVIGYELEKRQKGIRTPVFDSSMTGNTRLYDDPAVREAVADAWSKWLQGFQKK